MPEPRSTSSSILSRGTWLEAQRIAAILRRETIGGMLLLIAAVAALVWANAAPSSYESIRDFRFGPANLHLDLTVGQRAADGLLAIFFFIAGLELKREFVAGDLRSPRRAAVPVIAAFGGMAAPALIYVAINTSTGGGALKGWAIPTATDIAFALAVLAVIGSHLPTALRTFLLTLAVVDDLLAITIIALFFTSSLSTAPLALAGLAIAVFGVLVQKRMSAWWVLLPIAVVAWALVHASGVHATVAGVALAFTVPVRRITADVGAPDDPGMAERLEHRLRPISSLSGCAPRRSGGGAADTETCKPTVHRHPPMAQMELLTRTAPYRTRRGHRNIRTWRRWRDAYQSRFSVGGRSVGQ